MKQYLYISARKLDSLIAQKPSIAKPGLLDEVKGKLKLNLKVFEAELEGAKAATGSHRVAHLERLRDHIEREELSGNFGDANPFIISTVHAVMLGHNSEDDFPTVPIKREEVWFAGFESTGTAFLLRGSVAHLVGGGEMTPAPGWQLPSLPFEITAYVSNVWSEARKRERLKVEILAVRHQTVLTEGRGSFRIRQEPDFKLITGSPIYVAIA